MFTNPHKLSILYIVIMLFLSAWKEACLITSPTWQWDRQISYGWRVIRVHQLHAKMLCTYSKYHCPRNIYRRKLWNFECTHIVWHHFVIVIIIAIKCNLTDLVDLPIDLPDLLFIIVFDTISAYKGFLVFKLTQMTNIISYS